MPHHGSQFFILNNTDTISEARDFDEIPNNGFESSPHLAKFTPLYYGVNFVSKMTTFATKKLFCHLTKELF